MVEETLLEENGDLLEKTYYFEETFLVFEDVRWVAYVF